MNRTQLLAYHDETCAKAKSLMEAKNHDYTGSAGDDPFGNFRRTEALGICSTEAGMTVRLTDKLSRLIAFIQTGEFMVKDESVDDTIQDGINYFILIGAFLKQKRGTDQVGSLAMLSSEQLHDFAERTEFKSVKSTKEANNG